jgi:hypothetical protein
MSIRVSNNKIVISDANGETFNTDHKYLHCRFISGTISLPQRQATSSYTSNNPINQTDNYSLGLVETEFNYIIGMIRWTTLGNSERLVNDGLGKWNTYSGRTLQLMWSYAPDITGSARYQYVNGTGVFFIENVAGTVWLRDELRFSAPLTDSLTPNRRTRPASTFEYKLYCGRFT